MGKNYRAGTEEAWRAAIAVLPTLRNHWNHQPGPQWTWSSPQQTKCDNSLQDASKIPLAKMTPRPCLAQNQDVTWFSLPEAQHGYLPSSRASTQLQAGTQHTSKRTLSCSEAPRSQRADFSHRSYSASAGSPTRAGCAQI